MCLRINRVHSLATLMLAIKAVSITSLVAEHHCIVYQIWMAICLHMERPPIPHAFRVRLQQLPSLMRDTCLRLFPYFQNIFALIAPTSYMLLLSKNRPYLNFHCQSHAIALLPGWQVCMDTHETNFYRHLGTLARVARE